MKNEYLEAVLKDFYSSTCAGTDASCPVHHVVELVRHVKTLSDQIERHSENEAMLADALRGFLALKAGNGKGDEVENAVNILKHLYGEGGLMPVPAYS